MPRALKVLVVEDNPLDAELLLRHLGKADYAPEYVVVDNAKDYLKALQEPWDIILSDFELPDFNGLHALELLQQSGLKIPFIIVSGSIGEDVAVAVMRQGADDYLLKDRMARLGSAVEHALTQHQMRRSGEKAEQALRESEERFREVVETINEVFWVTEGLGRRMLYISPTYDRIWGRPRQSLYERPDSYADYIHPEDRDRIKQSREHPLSENSIQTYRIIRPDGAVRWIKSRQFPIKDADGFVTRVVGVADDITEHRELEEQLLRSQRMEAIGTLAGGVAHDLNNILAPTLMAADLLRQKVADPHGLELVDMIEQSMRRGAGIIRQMLVFSRGIGGRRMSVQPRHLLKEMQTLVRETFPRDIAFHLEVVPNLAPVVADATQLHQVIINLCVNARDAMPGGGTLTVTARNVMLRPDDVRGHAQVRPGRHILIAVTDTGYGIPNSLHDRIFEPFFTTKELGKGTGLGLSSVLGIVRSHGGFVTVTSTPGLGATFNVYLPADEQTGEAMPNEPAATISPRGNGELVLLVDDEEIIRRATRSLLEKYGYTVLTAVNGKEAVEAFESNRDSVKVLVTDLMMPVMGGVELIRVLRECSPELPIVVSSGLLDTDKRSELTILGVTEILPKPYGAKDLLEAVRRQLPGCSGSLAPVKGA